jgi:hypothetical protein
VTPSGLLLLFLAAGRADRHNLDSSVLQSSRISDLVERAVTVAEHEGLAKTAESVVIALGIPFGTQEQKV